MEIIIYTLPICPNCKTLKEDLDDRNIKYEEGDLENDDIYTELLLDCVTMTEAPIIKIDDDYYNLQDARDILL